MKQVKNLHILFPEKFFHDYISFVNSNFNPNEHLFLYLKYNRQTEPKAQNVFSLKYYRLGILFYWELYRYAKRSDKIILHSLSKNKLIYFLFLFSSFRKKSVWYLWGGDLYYRIEKYSKKIHNPISERIFKKVVSGLGFIATQVKGDVDLAALHFGFKGKHVDCFLYPSNLFKPLVLEQKTDSTWHIQLGNSSHPSNNHMEAIDRIAYLKNEDIIVHCPLSYGDKSHAALVKSYGKKVFGAKFIVYTDFMPFSEYLKFLSKMDIAIFNHWRQQGLGNIISLLGLGKTIYLRDDITSWNMLIEKGIVVFKINDQQPLRLLTKEQAASNIKNIKYYFSMPMLIKQSDNVFGS